MQKQYQEYIYFYLQLQNLKNSCLNTMSQFIPEFEEHKAQIPEFIIKLYHILEKKQYDDYLSWHGDDQILIKSGKKLEDKVLPHFFRHKHLSSFIRQLNMYKFTKVTKLTKQRNHMYFKNQNFQRGQIKLLLRIKRNNKKNRDRQSTNYLTPSKSCDDDEVSIMMDASEQNYVLTNYKGEIKRSFLQIKEILAKVMQKYPQTAAQLKSAKHICDQLMEGDQIDKISQNEVKFQHNEYPCQAFGNQEYDKNDNNNMLTTVKNFPKMDSMVFASQLSFNNFI